jgi:iron complex transport system substrate-binding protein
MRVVSVLPSATEIVCALGHRSELVGRSAECDYPEEVGSLPVVMRPRTWDADRPSREIDTRVRASREQGESLYVLDSELLRDLRPDLLLTQDLCGVCSVTEAEVSEACARAGIATRVVSLMPRRLDEVWRTVELVAEALDDRAAGERLLRPLRSVPASYGPAARRPSVAIVEWLDPPILAGLWTPDIVTLAGGSPVGPAAGEPGTRTTWDELASRAIDLLVLSPCSFSVQRTLREFENLELRREVERLKPGLGTFLADEAYFSRPGPRLAEGIRLVHDLLTGELRSPPMPVTVLGPGRRGAVA